MRPEIARKILEKTKEDFDKISEHFSATRQWLWKVMTSFLTYVKEWDKILDIGCGNGRLYELLKEKNIFYVGIDNSEKLIEIARRKFEISSKFKIQNSKPQFLVADALDLPFQNEEFNHVFMIAVLPHISSRKLQEKVLKNAYRVLKKEGHLFITCWNLFQPKYLWLNLKNRLANPKIYQGLGVRDFFIPWRFQEGKIIIQRFYHAFTKKELKKLLKKTGFRVKEIYYESQGKKSNLLKGFNLISIAKK